MKFLTVFVLLIYFCNPVFAQDVIIKGEALPENREVTLKALDHKSMDYVVLDSKRIASDRSFSFKTPFNGANLYQLAFDNREILYLSVDDDNPITITRTKEGIQIEGSPSTVKMRAFRAEKEELEAKYFGEMKKELDKAMADGNQAKAQAIMKEADVVLQDFLKEFRAKVIALGATPAGYYALQFSDFNKEIDFIQQSLSVFKQEAPNTEFTLALEKQVYQAVNVAVGKMPPAFTAKDQSGQMISPADFTGKILLIDFWASWCRACRVENPKFVELYKQYHQQDFEIISISSDENQKSWLKAIEKDGIQAWKHIWDEDKRINDLYSVSSLPQNLVLNKDGAIIAKNVDAERLAALLAELLD